MFLRRQKKRFRPLLESLESRQTPSINAPVFTNGNLSITDGSSNTQNAGIAIVQTSTPGALAVYLSTANTHPASSYLYAGTFANVANVTISLGNGAADSVYISPNAKGTLKNNFTITMGNGGGDTLDLENGQFNGNMNVTLGNGAADTLNIGATTGISTIGKSTTYTSTNSQTVTDNGVILAGAALNFTAGSANGMSVNIGGTGLTPSNLRSASVFTNVDAMTQSGATTTPEINTGLFTVNNANLKNTNPAAIDLLGTFQSNVNYYSGRGGSDMTANTVNGSLTYTGNVGNDSLISTRVGSNLTFTGMSGTSVLTAGVVGSNLNFTGGVGDATVTLGNAGTGSVGGSMTVNGNGGDADVVVNGSVAHDLLFANQGNDSITLDSGTSVGHNVTLNFGSGDNGYSLNNDFTIGNNFSLTTGDGDNDVGIIGPSNTSPAATIGGSMTFNMGNGLNAVQLSDNLGVGGAFAFTGGNGGDTVILGDGSNPGTQGYINDNVTVNMGNAVVGEANTFEQMSSFAINGNTVTYNGGTGSDNVIIGTPGGPTIAATYDLIVNMGDIGDLTNTQDVVDLSQVTSLNSATINFSPNGTSDDDPGDEVTSGPVTANKFYIAPPVGSPASYDVTVNNWV